MTTPDFSLSSSVLPVKEHGGQGVDALSERRLLFSPGPGTKVVDVPFVHYRQTLSVREVKVPVEVTKVFVKRVEVEGNHEIPIIQPREVHVHENVRRNIPDPVDVFTIQAYKMPRIQPMYYDVEVPIYVPRYVEVPVPSHFVTLQEEIPSVVPVGPPYQNLNSAQVLRDAQVCSITSAGCGGDGTDHTVTPHAEEQLPLRVSGSSDFVHSLSSEETKLRAASFASSSPVREQPQQMMSRGYLQSSSRVLDSLEASPRLLSALNADSSLSAEGLNLGTTHPILGTVEHVIEAAS